MMNLFLLPIMVLFFMASEAQKPNDITFIVLRMDSVTAKGKPIGQTSTKEIDKNGGNIFSDDGRLELVFPEDAISKKRKISIQPLTSTVVNGRGPAYHLEPSGIRFEKPVTIIFHYTEDELSGTLPELKSIAGQDENGKWYLLENVIADTVTKTIRSEIHHFSSYSSFDKILLKPQHGRS